MQKTVCIRSFRTFAAVLIIIFCTTHSLCLIPMGLFEATPSLHWHQDVGGIGTVTMLVTLLSDAHDRKGCTLKAPPLSVLVLNHLSKGVIKSPPCLVAYHDEVVSTDPIRFWPMAYAPHQSGHYTQPGRHGIRAVNIITTKVAYSESTPPLIILLFLSILL